MKRIRFAVPSLGTLSLLLLLVNVGHSVSDRTRSISGRVATDSGRPVYRAYVTLARPNGSAVGSVYSDNEARFSFDSLAPGSYRLRASSAGYVPVDSADSELDSVFYRPGDVVELILTKGAVITGKVTDLNGKPAVQARVTATSISDGLQESSIGMAFTDDRGEYRIFGLPAGTFLVRAGGAWGANRMPTPHDDTVLTFFSRSNSGPSPVETVVGSEVAGIDIQFRDIQGFTISGRVTGAEANRDFSGAFVSLQDSQIGTDFSVAPASKEGSVLSFSFENVPAGDYRVNARTEDPSRNIYISPPVSIQLRERDIQGITLALVRLPTVSGQIVWAPTSSLPCVTKRKLVMEELVIAAVPEDSRGHRQGREPKPFGRTETAPDGQGNFDLPGLTPGRYRPRLQIPNPAWYLQSLLMTASAHGNSPLDVARFGLIVNADERLSKLKGVMAAGAAQWQGQVMTRQSSALPGRLSVHLVPAEAEQTGNLLRYFETLVGPEGAFKIANIPPGRYWALARDETLRHTLPSRVVAWDEPARAQLLQEARAVNVLLDLPPCADITDYQLSYPAVHATASQGK